MLKISSVGKNPNRLKKIKAIPDKRCNELHVFTFINKVNISLDNSLCSCFSSKETTVSKIKIVIKMVW